MTAASCSVCGGVGYRDVLAESRCLTHYTELLRSFDPSSFGDIGVMLPAGRARPDFGPSMFDSECVRCTATGVASPGEPCPWCVGARDSRDEHQRDLVLSPPDVDRDDRTYGSTMQAWAGRLARAVESGLVYRQRAEASWRREVSRDERAA